MKISGIYKIQSQVKSERIYIGSAVNIQRRWWEHTRDLRSNKHGNGRLQNHFNKYGIEDLVFSILISCDKESLLSTEQFFIDSYNPYFNICKHAGSSLGRPPWNKGMKGKYHRTKGCFQKGHVPWSKGKKLPHKGYPKSEETKEKLRKAMTGKKRGKYKQRK